MGNGKLKWPSEVTEDFTGLGKLKRETRSHGWTQILKRIVQRALNNVPMPEQGVPDLNAQTGALLTEDADSVSPNLCASEASKDSPA